MSCIFMHTLTYHDHEINHEYLQFMPMYARIPWVAGTSLLWTCILSAMRGGDVTHNQDIEAPFPTGSTLTLFEEGLDDMFASPVDLDKSLAHVCISGAGPDKIGHVAKIARTVADGKNLIRCAYDVSIF